jgi:tetratricopeptide (TPR) repeat protein
LRYQGDLDAALSTIREARSVSDQAAYSSPIKRLFTRYAIMLREGRILGEEGAVNLGRPADAIVILQEALDLTEEAARNDPRDSSIRSRVATSARELGDILRDRDPKRALAVYNLGIQRLTEMGPSLKARRDHAQLLANSSYSLRRLHRVSEAKARIETAFAILRSTKDFPADRIRLGSYDFAIVRALADHQADTGDLQAALRTYANLLAKIEASQPKPEESLTDAVGLSDVYATIARLDWRAARSTQAGDFECRRLELWQRWDAKLPNNSFIRRQLAAANKLILQNNDDEDE